MKVLGIDFGERLIGLALADTETGISFPKGSVRNTCVDAALGRLKDICIEWEVERIVFGKPLNLAGKETASTRKALDFCGRLNDVLDGVEIVVFDERRTTIRAEEIMHEMDLSPSENRNMLNSIAASCILSDYMESL